ncbi:MAG TPA: NAD(P)-dependent oxidoreductase [Verrucomicrobiae bacterium]
MDTAAKILITGAGGFVGRRLTLLLARSGFHNISCLVRSSRNLGPLQSLLDQEKLSSSVRFVYGDLTSKSDCARIAEGAELIYHLAAGRGEKSFPNAFLQSAVATRNLLDATLKAGSLQRFVNISSFSVYDTSVLSKNDRLDETCPVEKHPGRRSDAYSFAKIYQDRIVEQYGRGHSLPYVLVRPGVVFGPGNPRITGRVGINSLGVFLHLGGSNRIPFTFVDNCAEAIFLAGVKSGIDREAFNIVDDSIPTSRQFLRAYKRQVRDFRSVLLPKPFSYFFCWLWEKYSAWSDGQLPPVYNRQVWHTYWKKLRYDNTKAKTMLGWHPRTSLSDAFKVHFDSCKESGARC